jgi:hypothetical protein
LGNSFEYFTWKAGGQGGGPGAGGGGPGGLWWRVVESGGWWSGRLFWSETFQSLFGAQSQNFLKDTSRYFFRMFCFAGFVCEGGIFDPSG